jgi:glycosyltransferase involved in cell wall biosynthesis
MDCTARIGAKRNVACAAARGDIIVHWDDDDWSFPGRIEEQVAALLEDRRRMVTGYNAMFFYDETTGQSWRYKGAANYAIGTSLCYWRAHWARTPFEDRMIGEDNGFVFRSRPVLHSIDAEHRMVARIHAQKTSDKLSGSAWTKVDNSQLPRMDECAAAI